MNFLHLKDKFHLTLLNLGIELEYHLSNALLW